jgi:hypothetical protein
VREPHKGVILQVRGGDSSRVAPVLWADVFTVRAATIGDQREGRLRESCDKREKVILSTFLFIIVKKEKT